VTDNGAMQSGTAHPLRESISHPYAAVPSTSNVKENANKDLYAKEGSLSPEMKSSHLCQHTEYKNENPGVMEPLDTSSTMIPRS